MTKFKQIIIDNLRDENATLRTRVAELEAEVWRLSEKADSRQALMAEAVRDFHGKTILFSAFFLNAAEGR